MVISRILFISTYDTTMDYEQLIKNHSLGDNVNYVSPLTLCLMQLLTSIANNPACKAISQVWQKAVGADRRTGTY